MPEPRSVSTSPVGIIISPGTARASASRLWAYVWSAEREAEHDPWHQRLPQLRPAKDPEIGPA